MTAPDLGGGQVQVTLYPDFILLGHRDDAGRLTTHAYPYSDTRLFARAVMDDAANPRQDGTRRLGQPE